MEFQVNDSVQPLKGGPKMTVKEVKSDNTLVCSWNEGGRERTAEFKSYDLGKYTEDGDFGVC